jgi:hypothetical protein
MMIHVTGNAQGLVHYEFIPEGHTVNKEVYVKTLHHLWAAVRRMSRKTGMRQLVTPA